jgi:5-methylthioribose kinase
MNQNELIDYLDKKNLLNSSSVEVIPLSGGVSCELLLMDDGVNRFVLKRALAKLKVKDDWYADVNRNRIEQQYLKYVEGILPGAVPTIRYTDNEHHFFCMEMLEGGLTNWKELLMNGQIDVEYAISASKILGEIHDKSAGNKTVEKEFDTLANFHELRIEPYLLKTGKHHPDLAKYFNSEAERLASVKKCLVHGDFSPKNILVSPQRLVLLDCEVAWYGDPVFDVAFFLNHFVLKALYLPEKALEYINLSKVALESYKLHTKNSVYEAFDSNLVRLLLMLMLARVDGKSPVEYLNPEQQQKVRNFVYKELPNNALNFETFTAKWFATI